MNESSDTISPALFVVPFLDSLNALSIADICVFAFFGELTDLIVTDFKEPFLFSIACASFAAVFFDILTTDFAQNVVALFTKRTVFCAVVSSRLQTLRFFVGRLSISLKPSKPMNFVSKIISPISLTVTFL